VRPYGEAHPPPSDTRLTELLLDSIRTLSPRMGEGFYDLALCHHWDVAGLDPRRSRYNGTFVLQPGTLQTPMLVISYVLTPIGSRNTYVVLCIQEYI
jgi:hypothetical protein